MAEHNLLGEKGEKLAVEFLVKKGYEILETNYRYRKAEVDIIAQQEDEIKKLSKQLQHQARKEQAALAHAKLNLSKSILNGGSSFVGVS